MTAVVKAPLKPATIRGLARFYAAVAAVIGKGKLEMLIDPKARAVYLLGPGSRLESMVGVKSRSMEYTIAHASQGKLDSRSGVQMRRGKYLRGARWFEEPTHWDALEYGMVSLVSTEDAEFINEEWSLIPIPLPGHPPRRTWSLLKQKWIPGRRVKWAVCDEDPIDFGSAQGSPLLIAPGVPPLFVSHGVAYESFRAIEKCGGFMWPSLAVTWRLPPAYGDIVFLADQSVLTSTLKPRGRRDLALFPSDVWTWTASEILSWEKAVNFELRGDFRWWANQRDREDGGWGIRGVQADLLYCRRTAEDIARQHIGDSWQDRVKSVPALVKRIKRLLHIYKDYGTPYEYEDEDVDRPDIRARYGSEAAYPYLELKAAGMVRPSDMVLCAYPRTRRVRVERFLDRVGFRGRRVPFTYTGGTKTVVSGAARVAWASAATAAVLGATLGKP
jgi:hypothetical protein